MVGKNGVALVSVLLLTSLMLIGLVGLLLILQDEEGRTSSFIKGQRAQAYTDLAFAEVIAKLMDGGEIPYRNGIALASMAACPGLMEVRRYDVLPNRGYQIGKKAFMDEKSFFRKPFAREYEREREGDWQPANPQWIALYSQRWYAPLCEYMTAIGPMGVKGPAQVKDKNPDYNPAHVFNMNTSDNPFTPGHLYFGGSVGNRIGIKNASFDREYAKQGREDKYRYQAGETNRERPLYVQWIPLYKDPRYGAITPNGKVNPIVGRYAYWVDVENTKININQVKKSWEQTTLGKLTGKSDGGRGERNGSYFLQQGENEQDTPRYFTDLLAPKTYTLFEDKVTQNYKVDLFYRSNYGHFLGENYSGQTTKSYEKWIFGWEEELPPAIADHTVVDWKAFSALLPYEEEIRNEAWSTFFLRASSAMRRNSYNTLGELYATIDPAVEKKNKSLGQLRINGLEKIMGQTLTTHGWEEERDPLGRAKLDINAIVREGDILFDNAEQLPRPNHQGTPLQQFLARLGDPQYYAAYYPGAYPSGGENLSLVDSLKAFAGKGVDADSYASAMRDQMVTNIIEYGRPHGDPPFIDAKRGIIGAKSMPYVTEIAIRARNAFWDLWDDKLQTPAGNFFTVDAKYDPSKIRMGPHEGYYSSFPGLDENELTYKDNFEKVKKSAMDNLTLAQKIADVFLAGYPHITNREDSSFLRYQQYGAPIDINYESTNPFDLPSHHYRLSELLNGIKIDVAFAVVNPDPFSKETHSDWEIEIYYSWFDPWNPWEKKGGWGIQYSPTDIAYFGLYSAIETLPTYHSVYSDTSVGRPDYQPIFLGADGKKVYRIQKSLNSKHYSPHLLPSRGERVDHLGYFFESHKNHRQAHNIVYFEQKIPVPGELIDGIPDSIGGLEGFFQSFRILGWSIYRKDRDYPGGRALYHQVPLRHPGQKSRPRAFWQMTVDRDGNGPEPPPNAGILASTLPSTYGLKTSTHFHYPDLHALEHFRTPSVLPMINLDNANRRSIALPFGLGIEGNRESWIGIQNGERGLRDRTNVATSWFSSLTIAEFEKFCESLMATIPPARGETKTLIIRENDDVFFVNQSAPEVPFEFTAPDAPYFYHIEKYLVEVAMQPPFRGLEGYLYFPERALSTYMDLLDNIDPSNPSNPTISKARSMIRSDIVRFILLQMKLRDEGLHHRTITNKTGRKQEATGRRSDDDFVQGMALVERLVCIDPVVGHRTGNPDLRIKRNGETYSGHFYGINGHPWRRYHYYFYHYDKDSNSPMGEVLGQINTRPEPDRCLTWYFSDPRREDGESEPTYVAGSTKATWGSNPTGSPPIPLEEVEYTFTYSAFRPKEIPLYSLTGSVLFDALLTKTSDYPNLSGELGWSHITEVEEDDVKIWPYGPGMDVTYGYRGKTPVQGRLPFRNGSFLTHSPRGQPMTSIGEIGLCHSGFLQRTIDLDRPPLYSSSGVNRLGAPQHGPPMSMLLDLVIPSNFRDENGIYLDRHDWMTGAYKAHSPENPRMGLWNINSKVAHDNYLAIREGAHGVLTNEEGDFSASRLDKAAMHPALVPSVVNKQNGNRKIVHGKNNMDPFLGPVIQFRRGWEQWLGAIAGDYSEHRNLGTGVWNKGKGTIPSGAGEVYAIAQGTQSFSWYPGGGKTSHVRRLPSHVRFAKNDKKGANLLILGKAPPTAPSGKTDWISLAGHVSADGPVRAPGTRTISMMDITRYGLFPMIHHLSEVGYTGLGKLYTALNHKNRTTSAQGGFWEESKMVDQYGGGDGVLGAMAQAGFARNAPWVMAANQIGTSANVFTVHIVTQTLQNDKDRKYTGKEAVVFSEQWSQYVIARLPQRDPDNGEIITDHNGKPHYRYRTLSKKTAENTR